MKTLGRWIGFLLIGTLVATACGGKGSHAPDTGTTASDGGTGGTSRVGGVGGAGGVGGTANRDTATSSGGDAATASSGGAVAVTDATGAGGSTSRTTTGALGGSSSGGSGQTQVGGAGGVDAGATSTTGTDSTTGDGGAAGEDGSSTTGPVICQSPDWLDCPTCPNDAPQTGLCAESTEPKTCAFDTGPFSTGTCRCFADYVFTEVDWMCRFDCGAEPPPQGAACDQRVEPNTVYPSYCEYSTAYCTCDSGQWDCGCPYEQPQDASDCTEYEGKDCGYADPTVRCRCDESSPTWQCVACPELPPLHASDCTGAPSECDFESGPCVCDPETNTWSCAVDCPAEAPENASACNGVSEWCPGSGDDEFCICEPEESSWNCQTCAETAPVDGSSCTDQAGLTCSYFDAECLCDELSETWVCEGLCPRPPLADMTACSDPAAGLLCIYPNDGDPRFCACDGNADQWRCLDCPESKPDEASSCSGYYGRRCSYINSYCICDTSTDTWGCVECPAAPPVADSDCSGMSALLCQYEGARCFCNRGTLTWDCN